MKLKALFFVSIAATQIISCTQDVVPENKKMMEQLNESSALIRMQSEKLLSIVMKGLGDASLSDKAERWYGVADSANQLTSAIVNQLDRLPTTKTDKDKATESGKLSVLIDSLNKMVDRIAPYTSNQFVKQRKITAPFGRSKQPRNDLLAIIRNQAAITEFGIIQLCNENTRHVNDHYTELGFIVSQNSTILQPGEDLEITAGIESFNRAPMPEVFIDGEPVNMNGTAIARYKKTVPSITGKQNMLVKISYKDQDGIKQTVQKTIYYTVK